MSVILVCLNFTPSHAWLTMERRQEIADSLQKQLATTKAPRDSIRLLYDMFDVLPVRDMSVPLEKIYRTAFRARDTTVMLDALRHLANSYAYLPDVEDSLQTIQKHRAAALSSTPEQRETVTYITLRRAMGRIRGLGEEERLKQLHHTLLNYDGRKKEDIYGRIEMLFTICVYLQDRSHSQLLLDYLKELQALVEKLPDNPGAVRNLYYNMAAIANTVSGHSQEAVKCDKKLLAIMRMLEKQYKARGRHFRNFGTNYYTTYQRMLANYEALSPEEIEEIYTNIHTLANHDPEIDWDMKDLGLTEAYYAMARGQYAKAIPLLKKAIAQPRNTRYKFRLLGMLIKAAQSIGDGVTLLETYQQYTPLLEARSASVDADRIIEHEILHDINTLEERNSSLERLNKSIIDRQRHVELLMFLGCAMVLIILMIVLFSAYRRARRLTVRLRQTNADLVAERDNLRKAQTHLITARDEALVAERQKTDFINTISHEVSEPVEAIIGYSQLIVDSVDDKRRKAMERFTQIIEINAQLLRTLVNDVLDVAELENSSPVVKKKNVQMSALANIAADSQRKHLQPGVTMTVEPMDPDQANLTADTDPARAEQVLVNIISNAVKFTEKGYIRVRYGLEHGTRCPMFIVEDTGPGIPPQKRQAIFNRFEKLGNSQGIGLGLYICQIVARLLGARVFVDPDYNRGARFKFVLPKA